MLSIHEEMQVAGKNLTKAGQIAAHYFVNELVDFGMSEKDIIRVAGFLIDSVRERIENPNTGNRNHANV